MYHSTFVRMFSGWLRNLNAENMFDKEGRLELALVEAPICAMSQMTRSFYDANVIARTEIVGLLSNLHTWLTIASECIARNQRLPGFVDGREKGCWLGYKWCSV